VIYRPDTELASHYFQAVLPRQHFWPKSAARSVDVCTAGLCRDRIIWNHPKRLDSRRKCG
jgi:hypothetical protein